MKTDVKIPPVGESITEVVVARWLKQDGEYVEAEEPLCEIESDKATFEIPAEQSGVLRILVQEGETVSVGSPIARIEANGRAAERSAPATAATVSPEIPPPGEAPAASEAASQPEPEKTAPPAAKPYPVKIPEIGESITEVVLAKWLKQDGEAVQVDDLLCEIESDKATFELPAEQAGILRHNVAEGSTVPVGGVVAEILPTEAAAVSAPPSRQEAPAEPSAPKPTDGREPPRVSPVAARILAEAGISPESVVGTGPGGRITKEDALRAVARQSGKTPPAGATDDRPATATATAPPAAPPSEGPEAPEAPPEPAPAIAPAERRERRERMSSLRKTIARRLVAAKNETAMLTTFNEVDMSHIIALRKRYKELFKEKYDIGLGFMSFFTRAVCLALKEWPAVNAAIDGEDIVYHDYCDISIAVSTPRGLVVPVIRNADRLSLAEIEREVQRLAQRAREGKLTIEEMTGGTFTITNGGVFGSLLSTPILNPPQAAILGMHRIQERPVVVEGQIVVRPMMYVALSYDHRIIDGRESVSFLVRVKELLEDPARMLLEV